VPDWPSHRRPAGQGRQPGGTVPPTRQRSRDFTVPTSQVSVIASVFQWGARPSVSRASRWCRQGQPGALILILADFCTAIRLRRSGGISNRSAAFSMASFSVVASTVPRCSARLRIISTRQRAISATASRPGSSAPAVPSNWAARRSCCRGRRTWRTSRESGTRAPRFRPDSTSISATWRQASLGQDATSRCTPRSRMLPRVSGGPGGTWRSLDDLVGAGEKRRRDFKAECLCGLEIDDQLDGGHV
jgi:hypothetical protein